MARSGASNTRRTTCGVLVADRASVLLGHASRSPRWDVFKGVAEPGEDFRAAALRELAEETGLIAAAADLSDLGVHFYLPGKDLALFGWSPAEPPDPSRLVCRSMVAPLRGRPFPEFDRFGRFPWETALGLVGRNLARVLSGLDRDRLQGPPDQLR